MYSQCNIHAVSSLNMLHCFGCSKTEREPQRVGKTDEMSPGLRLNYLCDRQEQQELKLCLAVTL
jgi:hypothetical protein